MDIRTQSALLASIVGLALGLSMLLRAQRPRVLTLYAVLCLSVGGYYLAHFLHSLFAPGTAWGWLLRITVGATIILGALVPSAALSFFLEFLGVSPNALRSGRRVALLSAVLGLAVGLTPLADRFWARVAVTVWVFGALSISVSLLLHRMRQSESRIERARLMYLASGAAASLLFAAADFLVVFQIPVPTLGPVAATLYLFFLAQTLLRLRLLDLHELLGKIASQTVLAVILASVFAVLTIWVGGNAPLFVFNTIVAAFVVIILLEPLRAKVEERVTAIFFRERYELLRSLANLRQRMANVIDPTDLARLVLDALNETRRVTHASIYLLAEDRPGFRLLDSRGPQPVPFLDAAVARGLLNAATSGQKALLLENLDRRVAEMRQHPTEGKRAREEIKRLNDMRQAMGQLRAGISVPLVGQDRVLGFMNLWDERVPEAYASDEIAQILEIGERFSTVIENSKLYDKMRERDRLAALGEMAAGLAHEIRNPLGAIKGAAQCLEPKRLPGEDGEFLGVIVEEVNRLNGVVTAFLDYARPLKQSFGPTDINEVVSRTVKLIQNEIPANVTLKEELGEGLQRIDGDAEQLKQVLINLVQNAIHAIGESPGTITIRTARPERFSDFRGAGEMVEVQVTDTGPGIPPDQQLHIFVPFFTTKQKGTGLGLAICQRIVKNHGGTISVQSRVGEGTTFFIRLPFIAAELPLLDAAPPEPALDLTPSPETAQLNMQLPLSLETEETRRSAERKARREKRRRRAGGVP
ncbi:MAG TPA: ATP-binding protein [Myxococcaceae bacterium]|nr:ATP-binding protein [Myxococcaceae bacterium]